MFSTSLKTDKTEWPGFKTHHVSNNIGYFPDMDRGFNAPLRDSLVLDMQQGNNFCLGGYTHCGFYR